MQEMTKTMQHKNLCLVHNVLMIWDKILFVCCKTVKFCFSMTLQYNPRPSVAHIWKCFSTEAQSHNKRMFCYCVFKRRRQNKPTGISQRCTGLLPQGLIFAAAFHCQLHLKVTKVYTHCFQVNVMGYERQQIGKGYYCLTVPDTSVQQESVYVQINGLFAHYH